MASNVTSPPLAPEIRSLLGGLRWRIRTYVWIEGLAIVVIWIAATFWLLLALDYLPVLLWASELPRGLRAAGAGIVGLGSLWILYRYILRRTFVRLADRSMAILLERRFPGFGESLVTTVELARRDEGDEFSRDMLETTRRRALAEVKSVRLSTVFRMTPLALKIGLALLLVVPAVALAVLEANAFELGFRRLFLLEDQPWPRSAQIEIVGVEVERVSPRTGELFLSDTRPFVDGEVKVARGASAVIRVRANTNAKRTPDSCRIYYRTEDGARGQVHMRRDGGPRGDGYQYYSYSGKPFQGVLDHLRFDVVGYDHRIRDHWLRVVDTPAVVETVLHCEFPQYLVDNQKNLWTPRELKYRSSGMQFPKGTKISLRMKASKPLTDVEYSSPGTGEIEKKAVAANNKNMSFEYVIDSLNNSVTLDIVLRDIDDVYSDTPHRIFIAALEDTAPQVGVTVRGIGSAVTPDVMIPATGTITDDHGVARSWFAFQINEKPPLEQEIAVSTEGGVDAVLDFRDFRANRPEAQVAAGDKLIVSILASDKYDLGEQPNKGQGDRLELEVVAPDELLIRLDRQELAQRRVFEHILDELTQMRDSLARVQGELEGRQPGFDPTDVEEGSSETSSPESSGIDAATAPPDADASASSGEASGEGGGIDLRELRVQEAKRQSEKSVAEVLGVAAAFRHIHDELVYNRIDAEDRKSRLMEQVAKPLEEIGETRFKALDQRLTDIEAALATQSNELVTVNAALNETNGLLTDLTKVLEAMLDIESYNELIELARALLDEQQELLDETKKARAAAAAELLK